MLLAGYNDEQEWILSRWNLTYKVGWDSICKAVSASYDSFDAPEILVDDEKVNIRSKTDILNIEEKSRMTIRGMSKILKAPIMITFYNQMQAVDVNIAKAVPEFIGTDYQKLNMSLCQLLNSMELAKNRK